MKKIFNKFTCFLALSFAFIFGFVTINSDSVSAWDLSLITGVQGEINPSEGQTYFVEDVLIENDDVIGSDMYANWNFSYNLQFSTFTFYVVPPISSAQTGIFYTGISNLCLADFAYNEYEQIVGLAFECSFVIYASPSNASLEIYPSANYYGSVYVYSDSIEFNIPGFLSYSYDLYLYSSGGGSGGDYTQEDLNTAYNNGYEEGYEEGYFNAYAPAYNVGYENGVEAGIEEANNTITQTSASYTAGKNAGIEEANNTITQTSASYTAGKNAGIEEANNTITQTSASYTAGKNSGIEEANNTITQTSASYTAGKNAGIEEANNTITETSASYIAGYDRGFLRGADSDNNLIGMVSSIFEGPVNMLISIFDFNFLGVNLASFFLSILSLLVVIWLIKRL